MCKLFRRWPIFQQEEKYLFYHDFRNKVNNTSINPPDIGPNWVNTDGYRINSGSLSSNVAEGASGIQVALGSPYRTLETVIGIIKTTLYVDYITTSNCIKLSMDAQGANLYKVILYQNNAQIGTYTGSTVISSGLIKVRLTINGSQISLQIDDVVKATFARQISQSSSLKVDFGQRNESFTCIKYIFVEK